MLLFEVGEALAEHGRGGSDLVPANLNAPLSGYGNLAPAYVPPTWHAPLAHAQYAETRAAERAARYATRANRANAPPQQHHLAQGIALDN